MMAHHEDGQGLVHESQGAVLHLSSQHALAVDQRYLLDLRSPVCGHQCHRQAQAVKDGSRTLRLC